MLRDAWTNASLEAGIENPLDAALVAAGTAASLDEIIEEMLIARTSERSGRLIDSDEAASMEKKKREGYF